MSLKEILNSHSVSYLKREISKANIRGYSKMKNKDEIVELMLRYPNRFNHITMKEKIQPKPKKYIKNSIPTKKGSRCYEIVNSAKSIISMGIDKQNIKQSHFQTKEELMTVIRLIKDTF